nr:AIPR family protein [Microbulbifer guangxiensis]
MVYTHEDITRIYQDFVTGVAPPVPEVELKLDHQPRVLNRGNLHRTDNKNNRDTYVVVISGRDLGEIYNKYGNRLFSRNVRGYIGKNTEVYAAIKETLDTEPDNFFYFNNGVTIIGEDASFTSKDKEDVIRILNPQVVNGQQTIRALNNYLSSAERSSVLVRIIKVTRSAHEKKEDLKQFLQGLVAGTNRQSSITNADLVSNDEIQIRLERELKKYNYLYIRKRQTMKEAREGILFTPKFNIKKEDLAKAVAGCELDPTVARSGIKALFNEVNYPEVFPQKDSLYFLVRYWTFRRVTDCSKGSPEWGYAKWVVLSFVWKSIKNFVDLKENRNAYRKICENNDKDIEIFKRAIKMVFTSTMGYFRENRGKGTSAQDISNFFRSKQGRQLEFAKYWRTLDKSHHEKFNKNIKHISNRVKELKKSMLNKY